MTGGASLRPLLDAALRRRRGDLEDLLTGPPGAAARDPFAGAALHGDADPEEMLRRLMVVLWPPVRRASLDGAARDVFLAQLARLEGAARGADLRFLDAWNLAYEAIASWPKPLREEGAARWILERYAAILDHHLAAQTGVSRSGAAGARRGGA